MAEAMMYLNDQIPIAVEYETVYEALEALNTEQPIWGGTVLVRQPDATWLGGYVVFCEEHDVYELEDDEREVKHDAEAEGS